MLQPVAKTLQFFAIAGIIFGVAELINASVPLYKIMTNTMVVVTADQRPNELYYLTLFTVHTAIGLYSIIGGGIALYFNKEFANLGNKLKSLIVIFYPATILICFFVGLPVSLWALYTWNKPEVKSIRSA